MGIQHKGINHDVIFSKTPTPETEPICYFIVYIYAQSHCIDQLA